MKDAYKGRTEEGEIVEVTPEGWDWVWAVMYKDGQVLNQFDVDRKEYHYIYEIEQEKALVWTLFKLDDITQRIDIVVPEGAKLIHRIRNHKTKSPDSHTRVWMFGYKTKEGQAHYNFILPGGNVVQSTDFNLDVTQFI